MPSRFSGASGLTAITLAPACWSPEHFLHACNCRLQKGHQAPRKKISTTGLGPASRAVIFLTGAELR